jgi:hypothetical protein
MAMRFFLAGALMLVAMDLQISGQTSPTLQNKPNAPVKSSTATRPSTLALKNDSLTHVSEVVAVGDGTVRITHDAGISNFAISELPAAFLGAWGVSVDEIKNRQPAEHPAQPSARVQDFEVVRKALIGRTRDEVQGSLNSPLGNIMQNFLSTDVYGNVKVVDSEGDECDRLLVGINRFNEKVEHVNAAKAQGPNGLRVTDRRPGARTVSFYNSISGIANLPQTEVTFLASTKATEETPDYFFTIRNRSNGKAKPEAGLSLSKQSLAQFFSALQKFKDWTTTARSNAVSDDVSKSLDSLESEEGTTVLTFGWQVKHPSGAPCAVLFFERQNEIVAWLQEDEVARSTHLLDGADALLRERLEEKQQAEKLNKKLDGLFK